MHGKRPNRAINTYTRTLTGLLTTTRSEAGVVEGGGLAYARKAPFQQRTPPEDDGIGESPSPDTPSSMESNNNNTNNNTNNNRNNPQAQGREEEIRRDDYVPDDSKPMVGNQSLNRAIEQSSPETQQQVAVPRSNNYLWRRTKKKRERGLGRVDGRLLRIRANQWNQGGKKEG